MDNQKQELIKKNAILSGILDLAQDAIISIDSDQNITLFNQGAVNIFGYSSAEILGKNIAILLPKRFISSHSKYVKEFAQNQNQKRKMGKGNREIMALRSDGTEFPAEATISKVIIKNEINLTVILRDITDRKIVEKEKEANLKESEDCFQAIFEKAPLGIGLLSINGNFLQVNEQLCQFLGYQPSELLNLECQNISAFNLIPCGEEMQNKLLSNKDDYLSYEKLYLRKNGELRWGNCHLSMIRDIDNNPLYFIVMIQDINERHQTQAELAKSEEKLRQITDNINDVFWITDLDNQEIIYVSPAYSKIWGHSCESLYQNPDQWLDLIHPQDRERVKKAFYNKEIDNFSINQEYRIIRSDGKIRWIYDRSFPIKNQEGKVYRIGGFAQDITPRKEVEKALIESEKRYRYIYNNTPVMLHSIDETGNITNVSDYWLKKLGYERHEVIGRKSTYFLTAESRQYAQEIVLPQFFKTGILSEIPYQFVCKNGTIIDILLSAFGERDEKGKFISTLAVLIDVTQWNEDQEQLNYLTHRLQFLLNSSPAIIYTCNANNFATTFVSPNIQQIFGYRSDEYLKNPQFWLDHIHPEDKDILIKNMSQVLKKGHYIHEYRVILPDNNIRWIHDEVNLIKDEEGNPMEIIGYLADIHQRKEIEESLNHQLQKTLLLQRITDEIRSSLDLDKIVEITAKKIGQNFNVSRCIIHNYHDDPFPSIPVIAEYQNRDFEPMLFLEIPVKGNLLAQQILKQDQAILCSNIYEDPLVKSSLNLCEKYQIKSFLVVRTSYQNKPNGVICLHQCDYFRSWKAQEIELIEAVSAQVGIAIAQAQFLKQEKQQRRELTIQNYALEKATQEAKAASEAKSAFLANMSHEIRTPMNAILGFTDLLKDLITEDQALIFLESIASSGRTLLALINDILDLSKIESGKLNINYEPIDLRLLITEIQQIFSQKASQKNIKLIVEYQQDFPERIAFDEVRLRQILFNVVGNALKFTDKGYICISANYQRNLDNSTIEMILTVEDTGIGIAPQEQIIIFDAFIQSESKTTRKYGGTGLGLAITKRLVKMLQGKVKLNSKLGKGSSFTFIFPEVNVLDYQISQSPSQQDKNLSQFSPMKILAVDDVRSNLALIQGYFRHTNHQILLAKDGIEALQMTKEHKPDLILLDLIMPNLNGEEVATILKSDSTTKNIPIIILTASAFQEEQESLKYLCQGYLHKPIHIYQLVEEIKKIMPVTEEISAKQEINNLGDSFNSALTEIPHKNSKELRELLEELKRLKRLFWLKITQTMFIEDIQECCQLLKKLGDQYQYLPLSEYANFLEISLQEFDLIKLEEMMNKYPEIIDNLQEYLSHVSNE